MKTRLGMLLAVSVLLSLPLKANNLPPVAVLSSTPDRDWFYNGEDVVFDYYDSYDPDTYLTGTRWYINNVLQLSGTFTFSKCFVLHGSPVGDCYELPAGQTTVAIKLGVKDVQGAWDYETITYTIREHKGRKYFVKDHLGSVRATVNRDGNVLGYDDYYPFGLAMPGRSSNSANPNDDIKFTGYEKDDEAGLKLYHAGNRMYDPVLGRFMQIDRFYDKYPNMSTYQYAANNPVNFIDVNGDSIDVSKLSGKERTELINNLAEITGYDASQFSVSNGMLVISTSATTKDGTVLKYASPVGGSKSARTFLNALASFDPSEHQLGTNFELKSGSASKEDGTLNFNRPNANNVDPAAWNVGMSFLHEGWHFARGFMIGSNSFNTLQNSFGSVGGIDPARVSASFLNGDTGPTVDFVNTVRRELGLNQRTSYRGYQIGNTAYIPFDQASKKSLLRGIVPARSSGFFYY